MSYTTIIDVGDGKWMSKIAKASGGDMIFAMWKGDWGTQAGDSTAHICVPDREPDVAIVAPANKHGETGVRSIIDNLGHFLAVLSVVAGVNSDKKED